MGFYEVVLIDVEETDKYDFYIKYPVKKLKEHGFNVIRILEVSDVEDEVNITYSLQHPGYKDYSTFKSNQWEKISIKKNILDTDEEYLLIPIIELATIKKQNKRKEVHANYLWGFIEKISGEEIVDRNSLEYICIENRLEPILKMRDTLEKDTIDKLINCLQNI